MPEPGIAIIGGGIAGASIAYHLSTESRLPITVYDKGSLVSETTARSAAFFGFYGSDILWRMKRYGLSQYNSFFAAPRTNPYYDLVGRIDIATSPTDAERLESIAADDHANGRPTQTLAGPELQEAVMLPDLKTDQVRGALYRPNVGYFDPVACAWEFIERAQANDVTFEPQSRVTDIVTEDTRVTGLIIDSAFIETRGVVCAAGPWNPTVAAHADVTLPVSRSFAPILKLEVDAMVHTLPIIIHADSGVYVRGHRDGSVLVGHDPREPTPESIDPDSVTDDVPESIRGKMWQMLEDYLPRLADATVIDEWVGIRSHTPDHHPIVGWTSTEGFSVAAFNTSGIQLSPAVGHIIATQLTTGAPTDYYDALSITRFDGHTDTRTMIHNDPQ